LCNQCHFRPARWSIESCCRLPSVACLIHLQGSLWSKLSEGLKGKATAELDHDSMKLALPDGGKIVITKARRLLDQATARKPAVTACFPTDCKRPVLLC
jgi:hypothetical protein